MELPMKFAPGCPLSYTIEDSASFILNIQPPELERQKILRETLVLTPDLPAEAYAMPESSNRYVRFQAPTGDLRIDYNAEIELTPRLDDPSSVSEVPTPELPFATLPHLYPSRYCQADRFDTRGA